MSQAVDPPGQWQWPITTIDGAIINFNAYDDAAVRYVVMLGIEQNHRSMVLESMKLTRLHLEVRCLLGDDAVVSVC